MARFEIKTRGQIYAAGDKVREAGPWGRLGKVVTPMGHDTYVVRWDGSVFASILHACELRPSETLIIETEKSDD
jgi:hypothetical protein